MVVRTRKTSLVVDETAAARPQRFAQRCGRGDAGGDAAEKKARASQKTFYSVSRGAISVRMNSNHITKKQSSGPINQL